MTVPEFDFDGLFDEDYFHFFADQLSAHSDAEADTIWRLLEMEPGLRVLDLGCGFGRISGRLAALGADVTGLDMKPLFLDEARRRAAARGTTETYVEGDMRELPWTGEFDRVVSWFTSFGYFDDDGNRKVLSEVARAVKPGGRFLIEMLARDWLLRHFQGASVTERDEDRVVDRHRFDPLTGRVHTDRLIIRAGRLRRTRFFVRMFTFTELRDWLLAAGFGKVEGFDATGEVFGPDSERMIVIATR